MVDQSPLLPQSQLQFQATRPQKFRAYVMTMIGISSGLALPALNFLGYFQGQSCPAIPSALAAIIVYTVVAVCRGPGVVYNCIKRVKAGELPAGQIELSGQAEDGSLCELYKGQLTLLKIDQVLNYLGMAIGVFWFLPIGIMHSDVKHDEEQCGHIIYLMIFVTGIISLIMACFAILALLAVGVGCIKKPTATKLGMENPKTPGITDFSGAL